MGYRENPADSVPSGPRDHSAETNPLTTRGRKRDRTAPTTPVGSSVFRERSKSLGPNFKKPRLPKRRLRPKNVPSRGNAPPAANVTTPTPSFTPPTPSLAPPTPSFTPPTASLAPPTPSLAPPTPSLAPPTPSLAPPTPSLAPPTASLAPPTPSPAPPIPSLAPPIPSSAPPTPSLAPPTSSLAPPTSSSAPPTPSLAPPSVTVVRSKAEANEEDDRRIDSWMFDWTMHRTLRDCEEVFFPSDWTMHRTLRYFEEELLRRFLVDREAKQRIVQLLRREDERSREQDSGQHLQKKQDYINLFRDIEESGKNWSEERSWRFQKSQSLPEELHKAVLYFLYRGHKDRLRRETRRLRRYQKLLKHWSKAFTQEEHDVCDWVGDCLKDMLAEVHRHIARFTRVERLLVPLSGFLVDREAKQRIVQLLRR